MARPPHNILPALLERALAEIPPGRGVWVALSGGMDSSLLLMLAAEVCHAQGRALYAFHVNHGLQDAAAEFESHSRDLCRKLDVALTVASVDASAKGRGVEGAAREARYAAFARHVPPGDTLWLAQHQTDQAETWLLAALRGSGVRGLGAMPGHRTLGGITLMRPWLDVSHQALADEAQALKRAGKLGWCDDPTNADTYFERNYLRHRVLPLLQARWPHAERALATTAHHMQDADALLTAYASDELSTLILAPGQLDAKALATRSRARQRLLVRTFCQQQRLAKPPARRLDTLLDQLNAGADAQVYVAWPSACARVWRGRLYLFTEERLTARAAQPEWRASWSSGIPCATPLGEVMIKAEGAAAETTLPLAMSWRQGGEVIRLAGRGRRDLKRLLAELGVPPWERHEVMVVWAGDTCIAAFKAPETLLCQAAGWQISLARVSEPSG
ncbi:MAG: tRNA lysidine(34) synthetase TilS [Halomonas sp.]|nr:tRNA lysidine(34) synthetase TilS [Halomonas sp.]MDN6296583.1 tRNA lysidine(34) synthetase TilS [Halomonas sp.]MDN6314228.1 tRNA lysidine(34) synthetase TilS [Halomonas sp.]MDN6335089.1 tRNA lysidine(34) synthetase TilS [Halomonas sp.]